MGDEERASAAADARRQLTAKGAKPVDTERLIRYLDAATYAERPDQTIEPGQRTPRESPRVRWRS